jgi:hypothetical protein
MLDHTGVNLSEKKQFFFHIHAVRAGRVCGSVVPVTLPTSMLEGDVWSALLPIRFSPGKELPVCTSNGKLGEPNSPYGRF